MIAITKSATWSSRRYWALQILLYHYKSGKEGWDHFRTYNQHCRQGRKLKVTWLHMHLPVLLQIAEIWCATSKNPRLRDPFLLQFPQPQKIIRSCLPWRESSLLPAVLIVFRLSEAEDNSIESESIDWTKSGPGPRHCPFAAMCNRRGRCIFHNGNVRFDWFVSATREASILQGNPMWSLENLRPQLSELFACHSKFRYPSMFFVLYASPFDIHLASLASEASILNSCPVSCIIPLLSSNPPSTSASSSLNI